MTNYRKNNLTVVLKFLLVASLAMLPEVKSQQARELQYQNKQTKGEFELEKTKQTAINGGLDEQIELGYRYNFGEGLEVDITEAIRWYTMAAKQGHTAIQFHLAILLLLPDKGTPNYREARKWLEQAAMSNHRIAQFYLGGLYERGQGTEVNYKEALRWYRQAAQGNNKGAQVALARMYEDGRGLVKDRATAYMWYRIASQDGNANTQWTELRKMMTDKEIADGERKAKVCISRNLDRCD